MLIKGSALLCSLGEGTVRQAGQEALLPPFPCVWGVSPLLLHCLLIPLRLSSQLQGSGLSLGDVVFPAIQRKIQEWVGWGRLKMFPHSGTLEFFSPSTPMVPLSTLNPLLLAFSASTSICFPESTRLTEQQVQRMRLAIIRKKNKGRLPPKSEAATTSCGKQPYLHAQLPGDPFWASTRFSDSSH